MISFDTLQGPCLYSVKNSFTKGSKWHFKTEPVHCADSRPVLTPGYEKEFPVPEFLKDTRWFRRCLK